MWRLTETHSLAAGFATWVLQRDGLRVPPFDAHPAGDGRLGALGLDGPSWLAWLAGIIRSEGQIAGALSAMDLRAMTSEERHEVVRLEQARDPIANWVGDPGVGAALRSLWRTYQPIGEDWARTITSTKRHSRISASQERRLWQQLERFHDHLPSLHVYPVDYPQVVALPVPPVSCVVGIGAPDPGGRSFVDAVVEAARELAITPG